MTSPNIPWGVFHRHSAPAPALPRLTQDWREGAVDPDTFVVSPSTAWLLEESGTWEEMNQRLGLLLSQFEEETVRSEDLTAIAEILEGAAGALERRLPADVRLAGPPTEEFGRPSILRDLAAFVRRVRESSDDMDIAL